MENAETGIGYEITQTSYANGEHRHGVLHRPGNGRDEHGSVACAACIMVPTAVQLNGVPDHLQRHYNVGAVLSAVFMPGQDDGGTVDMLEFGEDPARQLPLYMFADEGITLTLVTIDTTKDTATVPPELADADPGTLVNVLV